eukprot:gnl/TRDRNA2_/TRDRNA2_197634_c0_seq1.p1 gnl/TRDRNA2_/TRDRNA2_197634_c0~~gnl/TRDRNA2_/TRDRNA2_197634_c0_seq1.p1  ORF type:complete len:244 (-),score=45.13 gnl/TRDRNA2_/TRDRNA2_197634_c0_seq1:138-869(-)
MTAAVSDGLNPNAPEFRLPGSEHKDALNPNAPEFSPKLSDSICKMNADAAEFFPTSSGWSSLQSAAEAYAQRQKRQMPPASDEEWDQRIAKREKEVETIKSLQSYRLYIEAFPPELRSADDPRTPDPRDRTVSKRMWKWNVEKWRLQLKSRCVYPRELMLQCREYVMHGQQPKASPSSGYPGSGSDGDARAQRAAAVAGSKPATCVRLPQGVHEPPGLGGGRKANAEAPASAPTAPQKANMFQ